MGKKDFLKGALFGAFVGSVVALLTAPKKGKQTREEIKKLSADLSKKILKEIKNAKNLTREKYEEMVEKVVRAYGRKKRLAAAMLEEVIDDLKERWTEIKESLK